ncbi:MAG: hypothetical protein NTU43_05660, partial [Bacteroidetes bacterium]|nr:hypothetical protein [Bacteroidota bacterium]
FIFSDQLNPVYGVVSQSSNTGNGIDNSTVNNWTAGLKYYNFDSEKTEYSIGLVASNLFEPAIGFLNRSILPRRYTAHFIIKLRKKRNTEEKSYRLSIRVDKQNSFITSIIIGEYYFVQNFSLGVGPRLSFYNDNAFKNTSSFSVFAGWQQCDNIKVIFSYETNIGGMNLLGAGNSFEFGFNYLIPKSFCKKGSSYMDCPNIQ